MTRQRTSHHQASEGAAEGAGEAGARDHEEQVQAHHPLATQEEGEREAQVWSAHGQCGAAGDKVMTLRHPE